MIVDIVDPEGTLLREIEDKRMKRDDIALTYAFAIRQHDAGRDVVNFARVNRAILDRWSMAALKYIKEKAWRYVQGKETPDA